MSSPAWRILIVEDQFLIAMQLQLILTSAGHVVVGTAGTREAACEMVLATSPDIVFVDVSLADGATGIEVADFIRENGGAHVVFTTANRRRLPPDFCGAIGVVEKPFTRAGLMHAINFITAWMKDEEVAIEPESLHLSPQYEQRWRQQHG